MNSIVLAIVSMGLLVGCAATSGVMELEGGAYMISARAAPARGGTAGANAVAYEEAQKFCVGKDGRAVLVDAKERDVYQSAVGASWNSYGGSAGGGTFAAGSVTILFKCVQ